MAHLFLRLFAPGNLVVRGRKGFPRLSSFTVLKTVDQYEALVVDHLPSSQSKKGFWHGIPIAVVSFIAFLWSSFVRNP
jgi:hypothetical protein